MTWRCARRAVWLCLILVAAPAAVPTEQVLHVDGSHPAADDAGAGTLDEPLRTLQAALTRALRLQRQGRPVRVVVHPGLYRESVRVFGRLRDRQAGSAASLVVEAAAPGTAIVSGAEHWTDWTRHGAAFVHDWPHAWGVQPDPFPESETPLPPISRRREMVFIDGRRLTPVLDRAALHPGSFYVDEQERRLYVVPGPGVDLERLGAEVAVREVLWDQRRTDDVALRGLVFLHAATPWTAGQGAVRIVDCMDVRLEQVRIEENNWVGLFLGDARRVRLSRVVMNRNGGQGWNTWHVTDLHVEDSETSYNNWRGALGDFYGWAVGNKLEAVHGLTIRRHRAVGNHSRGLWLDFDVADVELDGLCIAGNALDGLWLEANHGPVQVRESRFCGNGGSGLRATYSEQVTLEHNTLAHNARSQLLLTGSGERTVRNFETGERVRRSLRAWTLMENTFAGAGPLLEVDAALEEDGWSRLRRTLRSDANHWYSDASEPFRVLRVPMSLRTWQQVTGQDGRSTAAAAARPVCPDGCDEGAR